jgi:hypothetical protein
MVSGRAVNKYAFAVLEKNYFVLLVEMCGFY